MKRADNPNLVAACSRLLATVGLRGAWETEALRCSTREARSAGRLDASQEVMLRFCECVAGDDAGPSVGELLDLPPRPLAKTATFLLAWAQNWEDSWALLD